MQNLMLPNARLLFLVTELWKENIITDSEKLEAKRLIITDDSRIKELLSQCEQQINTGILKENITYVLKSKGSRAIESKSSLFKKYISAFESDIQTKSSSPLGDQLFERKKRLGGSSYSTQSLFKYLKASC